MITKIGDRWNWDPTTPLNQGNLDLFNFAQRSLSSICLITTCFPSRFINFRTCFSQLTVIFQQFSDNLLFLSNWRQYLISRGQREQKSAQVFAVIWGARGKRQEARGDWGARGQLQVISYQPPVQHRHCFDDAHKHWQTIGRVGKCAFFLPTLGFGERVDTSEHWW